MLLPAAHLLVLLLVQTELMWLTEFQEHGGGVAKWQSTCKPVQRPSKMPSTYETSLQFSHRISIFQLAQQAKERGWGERRTNEQHTAAWQQS
jgi:hypothetical protein